MNELPRFRWESSDKNKYCRLTTRTFTWRRRPPASRNPFPFSEGLPLKMAALRSYETSSQSSVLRGRWSGVRILIGETDFSLLQNVQTGSEAHPASYSSDDGVVYRGRAAWGVKLTTQLVLVSTLQRVSIPVLPVYAFVTWTRKSSRLFYRTTDEVKTDTYDTALNVEWFLVSPVLLWFRNKRSEVFTAWKTRSCCIKEAAGRSNTVMTRRRRL